VRTKLTILVCTIVAVAASAFRPAAEEARSEDSGALRRKAAAVPPEVVLTPIAGQLGGITAITHAGDERLFVTLQRGRIVIVENGAVLPTPFLDISSRVVCCGEQGLLSTAFHPQYAENGFFYVDYTDTNGDTVIARYEVTSDPNVADPFTGVTLLTIDQPFANHNGGQLAFGPDGMLYVGMGDGGSGGDPQCYAQRREPQEGRRDLLGKLLRLDVNQNIASPPYHGIPDGNPFVATDGPDEAWAIGLRNPWRFSFDRLTGDLFLGDVGQGTLEEIDFQLQESPGGENYGWKMMEGTDCTGDTSNCPEGVPACGSSLLTLPILEYGHGTGRCSVTGGYVYRGQQIPDLFGRYVYGDYCSGEIWAAFRDGNVWTTELLPIQADTLSTFGEDAAGEMYVGNQAGNLYRIDALAPGTPVVTAITPTQGYERGSDRITITGSGFAGGVEVLFGGTPAHAVMLISPTELVVRTPAHAAGPVDVTVTNPGAPPTVEPAGFVYVEMPHVTPGPRDTRVLTRPPAP
jgi:glucose/arabinose dehydrogenase